MYLLGSCASAGRVSGWVESYARRTRALGRRARGAADLPTHTPGPVRYAAAAGWEKLHPSPFTSQETTMGKYFLAWLLGVPGIVLLLVYLFFH